MKSSAPIDFKCLKLKESVAAAISLLDNNEWIKCDIIIQFPPAINKGYVVLPSFWDAEGKRIRLFPRLQSETMKLLYDLIREANIDGSINEIVFIGHREALDASTIELRFNQKIVDDFESNLPESQWGTTVAWFKSQKMP